MQGCFSARVIVALILASATASLADADCTQGCTELAGYKYGPNCYAYGQTTALDGDIWSPDVGGVRKTDDSLVSLYIIDYCTKACVGKDYSKTSGMSGNAVFFTAQNIAWCGEDSPSS